MEYRDLEGYRVYEDGSIKRIKTMNNVSQHLNHKGYYQFSFITEKGKRTTRASQRFICRAWYGEPPEDGNLYEADHKDFDRTNNHKDNLQWLTKSQNNQKTWDVKNKNNNGTNNGRCNTTEKIVIYICKLLQLGYIPAQIRDMGYNYGLIRQIRSRNNWAWLSKDYKW